MPITCPVCSRTTHHPVDVLTGWCSACQSFTGKTDREVRDAARVLDDRGDSGVAGSVIYRLERYGARS